MTWSTCPSTDSDIPFGSFFSLWDGMPFSRASMLNTIFSAFSEKNYQILNNNNNDYLIIGCFISFLSAIVRRV